MITILVTGSRDWTDWKTIEGAIVDYVSKTDPYNDHPYRLVEGGAKGADRLAREAAKNAFNMEVITVEAEWEKHGRRAGMLRNIKMLNDYSPDVVLAFPKKSSIGTLGCISEAIKREIPIHIFYERV